MTLSDRVQYVDDGVILPQNLKSHQLTVKYDLYALASSVRQVLDESTDCYFCDAKMEKEVRC